MGAFYLAIIYYPRDYMKNIYKEGILNINRESIQ